LTDREDGKVKIGDVLVEVDANYFRPTEVDVLIGDAGKARKQLNWIPKVKFNELVKIMALADWEKVQKRGF
jgi:GDPmannose 4,6-dehydratase